MNANSHVEALPSARPAHIHALRRGTSITATILLMLAAVGFMTPIASADGCGPRIYYKSSHRGVSRTISYGSSHHYASHRSCGPRTYGYSYTRQQYENGRREGHRDGYDRGYHDGYGGRASCNTEPHWVQHRPKHFRSGYHDTFHGAYDSGYRRGHNDRYHRPCITIRPAGICR